MHELVIFDCDGVLVDSEVISNELLARYPDSGKVWARSWPPGAPRPDGAVDLLVRPDQEPVDYLDGQS